MRVMVGVGRQLSRMVSEGGQRQSLKNDCWKLIVDGCMKQSSKTVIEGGQWWLLEIDGRRWAVLVTRGWSTIIVEKTIVKSLLLTFT